jgi:NAD(P)H-nitrite reductase large subunit
MAPPGLIDEDGERRTKVVVVGLGMVGIAFIEKLIQKDKKRGDYEIVVLGEEKHVAYNRVGLTSFFCIPHTVLLLIISASIYSRSVSQPSGLVHFS